MKKLENIETFINKLITSIFLWIKNFILKITPTKFNQYIQEKILSYRKKKNKLKQRFKKKSSDDESFIKKSINVVITLKGKLTSYISSALIWLKAIQPKDDSLKVVKIVQDFFLKLIKKIILWYKGLSPKTIWISFMLIIIATIAGLQFYVSIQKVYKETKEKEVAEVIKEEKRPKYYKRQLKQFKIDDLKMPIYVKSAASIRSLTMDLTMESSNRYIKQFFDKHDYYIQDQLNSSIEPIIPTFPLESEGKRIIKDKLKLETNELLKKLKIEGTIDDVHFHNIIAS